MRTYNIFCLEVIGATVMGIEMVARVVRVNLISAVMVPLPRRPHIGGYFLNRLLEAASLEGRL